MSKYQDLYDAYVYAYSAVIYELTHRLAIIGGAKENEFIHSSILANADFKSVVAPNIDNIYSTLWLDLSKGAYELHKPQLDRYLSVAFLDAYTNCENIVGTGADGNDEQDYIIAGPDFNGTVPAGYKLIKLPTNNVWGIVRTIVNDEADIVNVKALQNKLILKPLSGTQPVSEKHYANEVYKPIIKVQELSLKEYFDIFNELLVNNKDPYEDTELLEKVKPYGIGAGLSFDEGQLDEETKNIVKDFHSSLHHSAFSGDTLDGWGYPDDNLGVYKYDYLFRASVAYYGLGANPVSMCIYPSTYVDADNNPLDGNNKYVLHIDSAPDVLEGGFWSFTLYDSKERYLVANEIDRYGINDRTPVKYNPDGSLDIFIQSDRPEESKVSNWLPAPKEGFNVILRVYLPKENVINKTWKPDAIRKI